MGISILRPLAIQPMKRQCCCLMSKPGVSKYLMERTPANSSGRLWLRRVTNETFHADESCLTDVCGNRHLLGIAPLDIAHDEHPRLGRIRERRSETGAAGRFGQMRGAGAIGMGSELFAVLSWLCLAAGLSAGNAGRRVAVAGAGARVGFAERLFPLLDNPTTSTRRTSPTAAAGKSLCQLLDGRLATSSCASWAALVAAASTLRVTASCSGMTRTGVPSCGVKAFATTSCSSSSGGLSSIATKRKGVLFAMRLIRLSVMSHHGLRSPSALGSYPSDAAALAPCTLE